MRDQFGYPTTIEADGAAASWDACVLAFLAHGAAAPAHLEATLAGAPDFAMGWAAKGLFLAMLARAELRDPAAAALETARRFAADARERAYVDALALALDGRLRAAADRLDAELAARPADALAMKLSHALRFMAGDAIGMLASIEAIAPAYGEDHPCAGYAAGCRAFAREECGDYAGAEVEGRRALALAPDDAWGLHAVAHVFEMTGRAREGAVWLDGREGAWAHCNNFGAHVWWHLALFRLDEGETEAALSLYDEKVRAARTDDFRDVANAASLLARLETEGVAVGRRWEELAGIAGARIDDACNIFADLHYLIALVGDGRGEEARRLAARIAGDARAAESDYAAAARAGAGAAAAGLAAWSEGGLQTAAERLGEAVGALQPIGGSHAQRDVFSWLAIEAAIRAGRSERAAAMIADRARPRRGADGFSRRRFARLAAAARPQVAGIAL